MKERPILFSGEMVKAILDGRKTQTRRVVKSPKSFDWWELDSIHDVYGVTMSEFKEEAAFLCGGDQGYEFVKCPYGQPGDRLWVRETFTLESSEDTGFYDPPHTDGRPVKYLDEPDRGKFWLQPHYRATDPVPELAYDDLDEAHCRWKPSIHMPRWVSRITLEITDIRVGRVQDITWQEVDAEGVDNGCSNRMMGKRHHAMQMMAFPKVWDSINAKRGYSWESNPWVWVVEFEQVTRKGPHGRNADRPTKEL